jgi:hypothetical protein
LPGGFATGKVSCMIVIGTRLYGMMASNRASGKDEPFCYDIDSGSYIAISGITATNTPDSPPVVGSWVPPHAELIGTKIVITHTGFSGTGSNFFGVIDISNPSSLTYTSANTATNALPAVPVWVTNFFGRAYYYCNIPNAQPGLLLSDVLNPTTRSNAAAAYTLTLDDNVPLLCGGVFSVSTQLGGQTPTLFVFKRGAGQIYQIKGDPALTDNPTSITRLNVATGTYAPNSVVSSPLGLMFMSPDGLRVIDFDGRVSNPIGANGTGKVLPFMASSDISRLVIGCNGSLVRISSNDASISGSPRQEWVYDLPRQNWYGPNTFPIHLIAHMGYEAIIAADGNIKGLWRHSMIPTFTSTYLENEASYTCVYQTAYFPDRPSLEQLALIRAVIYRAVGAGEITFNVSVINNEGNVVDFATIQTTENVTFWDQFVWGAANWLGTAKPLSAIEIPLHYPIAFDRIAIQISVVATQGIKLGSLIVGVEELGYTVQSS